MKQTHFPFLPAGRCFLALVVVFFCLSARHAFGQAASLYENNAVTVNPVPIPDATNFVNNSTFTITEGNQYLYYQTHDTVNYTNNGYMYNSVYGFDFDTYSTATSLNSEAGTFDNEDTIESAQQIQVWATNIVDPGWNYSDSYLGLMNFNGSSVDLNNTTLIMESSLLSGIGNISSEDYGVGISPDPWSPSTELLATYAQSAFFNTILFPNPRAPDQLTLPDSTCYFDQHGTALNPIYRVVFVEDENPAIIHNVYFAALPDGTKGLVTVQWSGAYTNNATGQISTNYLYLQDEPVLVNSNNVSLVNVNNGFPNNYLLQGSPTPVFAGPGAAEGYEAIFPPGEVTNFYSYLEAQLIATTITTNTLINTNVAAIGGRIEMAGANELELNQAQIGGENYMSIMATNQFDGNNGASISAPFADIAIGVTNPGSLTVSNLLEPDVPVWNGTVQAWTTRWIVMTTNTVGTNSITITNDFRVELVLDDLTPTTPSQVKDLSLTGTNSVQISDDFNVFGNFFANTRSLTLTTNGMDNGAESEEGVLNFENPNILWPSAMPYLLWLTNNGTINIGNEANFGAAAPTYITNTTPAVPAIPATGTLSEVGGKTNVLNKDQVSIGSFKYTFVLSLTNKDADQVKIAGTFNGSMSNLIAAINHTASGTNSYSTNTAKNTLVAAGVLSNSMFIVTATTNGVIGNSITNSTTSLNLFWATNTLAGGASAIPEQTNVVAIAGPYDAFVNNGMISDYGSQIYSSYFENIGLFDNIYGPFVLNSITTVMTNAELFDYYPFPPNFTNGYSGDITIAASNLVISGSFLAAGGGLTLEVTNCLYDSGVSNGNQWYLDGGSSLLGLDTPLLTKPTNSSLLGTTITMFTPSPNKPVKNYWNGIDEGATTNGYVNNMAIGQLILNVQTEGSSFHFSGPPGGTGQYAIYVDRLVLENWASYANGQGSASIPTLNFNTNLVIYYADAQASSTTAGGPLQDVSYLLNGSNTNHLQWVPEYAGYFSSTNMVYPNGSVNTLNIGLVTSPFLDSNGNGTPNADDPEPIFVWSQIDLQYVHTNGQLELIWNSVPGATNYIVNSPIIAPWYSTNWVILPNLTTTNALTIPPPGGWPITNSIYISSPSGYYRVMIDQDNAILYGE